MTDEPHYRDPHPTPLTKARWLVRKHLLGKEPPPVAYVTLCCPKTGEVFATENTDVDAREFWPNGTRVSRYDCQECGGEHRFVWGAPAPIRLPDQPREEVDFEVVDL